MSRVMTIGLSLVRRFMPVPPGQDKEESTFRRDFALALMASPSTYFAQTWSGRESHLYEGGSHTDIVAVVAPPLGYAAPYARVADALDGYPPDEVWYAWLKRTQDVARLMPGVNVPTEGDLRGIRAPWAPSLLRVPGIVRNVSWAP